MQYCWRSFLFVYGRKRPVLFSFGHTWKVEQSELGFSYVGSCTDPHRVDFHCRMANPSSFQCIGLIQTPSMSEQNSDF
jgi:hypothetical protein